MIEIYTIGGFLEIGRNMTLVKYKDEAVVLDMGLHMSNYISLTENEDIEKVDYQLLLKNGAVPDLKYVEKIAPLVKAIIPTHAHLDHLGAIPYLSNFFPNATILGTMFSCEVLERISKEDGIKIPLPIKVVKPNSSYTLSKKIKLRFIEVTHSTPQTVMVIIETPEGKVAYANDFKFDKTPIIGKKPNKKVIRKCGGVRVLIMDTLYGKRLGKTPSEAVAKQMLKDILFDDSIKENNALIITTFSSHIARAKTICNFGKRLKRKVVFFGRSFRKYLEAAAKSNVYALPKGDKVVYFSSEVKRWLKKIRRNPEKFLAVVTGHQAEKKAVLSRMNEGLFEFKRGDVVIFSSNVIPDPNNEARRAALEASLQEKGIRVFSNVHVSGHASREDHRMLLTLLKPTIVIPAHSDKENAEAFIEFIEKDKLSKGVLAREGDKIIV